MTRVISLDDIKHDPSSYVDPHGFVFYFERNLYRYINGESVPFFMMLFKKGILSHLEREFSLVKTEFTDIQIAEKTEGTVVQHEYFWPLTYCVEWCPSMLKAAGLLTLDLAIELSKHDLMLQDAHPWNILFSGCKPVFVDLTSIVQTKPDIIWPAHEQFEAFFLRPLTLCADGKGLASRALLFNNIEGIGLDNFYIMVSTAYRIRHPGLIISYWFYRLLQRYPNWRMPVAIASEKSMSRVSPNVRLRFLRSLSRRLSAIYINNTGDPWTNYYAGLRFGINKDAKINTVRNLLSHLKPKSLLDLGCNTGVFSIEAARQGIKVISLDKSESCIEILFAAAFAENLTITPLVADILCPVPRFGFLGYQYQDMITRIQSDTVLCLGLMHHLYITGLRPIEDIIHMLQKLTNVSLIFEYVDKDDKNIPYLTSRRNIYYSLERVIATIKTFFSTVVIMPSDRSTRKLLVCNK